MHPLLRNWKVLFAIVAIFIALGVILVNGLRFGTDFTGGTVLLFRFDKALTTDQIKNAVTVLEKRLNWTGLMDVTVRPWGNQYVYVRIGEVDPDQVEFIKQSILRQGKFEATVKGEVALEGQDVILKGDYSITPDHINGGYQWEVPFLLTDKGAKRFFSTLKKYCTIESCPDNFFFIDRPVGAIIIVDKNLYEREKVVPRRGVFPAENGIDINEVLLNAGVTLYIYEGNLPDINFSNKRVIIPNTLKSLEEPLKEQNAQVLVVPVRKERSWIWDATNLRAIIGVSPQLRADIVSAPPENPVVTHNLVITGWAPTKEEAQKRVEELRIILSSGSLPAGLMLVSEQSIPPSYGKQALFTFALAVAIAMIAVSLFIAFRYREPFISLPIIWTILSETILVLGFASLIGWRLDVASLVGLIAGIGSGVDDQIIITDEMLRRRGEEETKEVSLLSKIKRAFFVVFASASALGAVMIPLWFSGVPSLMGFAITTLAGIFFGVLITRPAYAEIVKYFLVSKRTTKEKG